MTQHAGISRNVIPRLCSDSSNARRMPLSTVSKARRARYELRVEEDLDVHDALSMALER